MTYRQIITIHPAEGKEFVPIEVWVKSLSEQEQLAFNAASEMRETWLKSLKLDGTILSYDVNHSVREIVWENHPETVFQYVNPEWERLRNQWLTETNQTRTEELIEE